MLNISRDELYKKKEKLIKYPLDNYFYLTAVIREEIWHYDITNCTICMYNRFNNYYLYIF